MLIFGPPGAGKTTLARSSGLGVYDRDDPQWVSEQQFRKAISALGQSPSARAAVIRSGATRRSRRYWTEMVKPTRVVLLKVDAVTCESRIRRRKRPRPSLPRQIAAVHDWYERHEPDEYPPPLDW